MEDLLSVMNETGFTPSQEMRSIASAGLEEVLKLPVKSRPAKDLIDLANKIIEGSISYDQALLVRKELLRISKVIPTADDKSVDAYIWKMFGGNAGLDWVSLLPAPQKDSPNHKAPLEVNLKTVNSCFNCLFRVTERGSDICVLHQCMTVYHDTICDQYKSPRDIDKNSIDTKEILDTLVRELAVIKDKVK